MYLSKVTRNCDCSLSYAVHAFGAQLFSATSPASAQHVVQS
jgi:hypothetical protein